MKRMIILLAAVLMLTACSGRQVEDRLDAVGDKVESGLDKIMDNTTAKPDITQDKAVAIALEHAGTTKDKITGLRTEYEVDDGVGHYDIRFLLDGKEYDCEIDGKTGEILSFEKDD